MTQTQFKGSPRAAIKEERACQKLIQPSILPVDTTSNHQHPSSRLSDRSYQISAIMKTSILVLLGFCAVMSTFCCVDAAYAQSKSAQIMADFYDMLAQLQREEKMANMQQGWWQNGGSSGSNTRTVYCYSGSNCSGALKGTGTAAFCCASQGEGHSGGSYKGTSSGATCYNCS